LSYSKFECSGLKLSGEELQAGDSPDVEVQVKNTSEREGDEVTELYLSSPKVPGAPLRARRGFTRVHLNGRIGRLRDYCRRGRPGTKAAHREAHLTIRGQEKLPD
jgi:hypothetical protein